MTKLTSVTYVLTLLLAVSFWKAVKCEKKDLYGQADDVVILDGSNLKETLQNKSSLWLVEYYSSWCGTCHEFAPIYRALAKDVAEWSYVMNTGVVDCSDTVNVENCRDMAIDHTPTLRLYSANWNPGDIGVSIENKDIISVKKIREAMLPFIEKEHSQLIWNHDVPPPVLKPASYNEVMEKIDQHQPILHVALVFEDTNSNMGKEIVLDMSSCSNVEIVLINASNEDGMRLMEQFSLDHHTLPHVLVSTIGQPIRHLNVTLKARAFYVYQLERLAEVGKPRAKLNWQIASDQQQQQGVKLTNGNTRITQLLDVAWDRTYVADIESAMNYLLTVEVSANKVLEGKKLKAVKKLVEAFVQTKEHFPGRTSTRRFMEDLHKWLIDRTAIDYNKWDAYLQSAEGFPSTNHMWVGCSSNEANLRGYPCGLWTTFHALSVACYNAKVADEHLFYDAMSGYITNFFSCLECRKNFGKEIDKIRFDEEPDHQHASILWLWRLHNSVNMRLHANSSTEDPQHEKIQFPSKAECPRCRYSVPSKKLSRSDEKGRGEVWDERRVADYLIERYSSQNLLYTYLDHQDEIKVEKVEVGGSYLQRGGRLHRKSWQLDRENEEGEQQRMVNYRLDSQPMFSSFDMNLCLFFWLTSFLFAFYIYTNVSSRGAFRFHLSPRK